MRRYEDPGGGRQVSTDGGRNPVWSPSGREVYYRSGNDIMAVQITTEPSFAADRPEVLFEWAYEARYPVFRHFDISPDGRRFVMMQPEREPLKPHFRVVQNWFEELKRRVPVDN